LVGTYKILMMLAPPATPWILQNIFGSPCLAKLCQPDVAESLGTGLA
jgi:hypothetical protein